MHLRRLMLPSTPTGLLLLVLTLFTLSTDHASCMPQSTDPRTPQVVAANSSTNVTPTTDVASKASSSSAKNAAGQSQQPPIVGAKELPSTHQQGRLVVINSTASDNPVGTPSTSPLGSPSAKESESPTVSLPISGQTPTSENDSNPAGNGTVESRVGENPARNNPGTSLTTGNGAQKGTEGREGGSRSGADPAKEQSRREEPTVKDTGKLSAASVPSDSSAVVAIRASEIPPSSDSQSPSASELRPNQPASIQDTPQSSPPNEAGKRLESNMPNIASETGDGAKKNDHVVPLLLEWGSPINGGENILPNRIWTVLAVLAIGILW
ncbi:hypothetical protein BKA69DRAFT_426457 [Paraphysoderma sedebokerense]|nr:hypothetical protein BKA69DRAFT_426457 [Paraphysoderma sedebokerense]